MVKHGGKASLGKVGENSEANLDQSSQPGWGRPTQVDQSFTKIPPAVPFLQKMRGVSAVTL